MRFRGTLVDVGILQSESRPAITASIARCAGILQSLEKVDSKCVLHLAPGKFNCIVRSDQELGIQAYAHLKADLAFENFTVESNSDNNIQFLICIETLHRAVKAANNAGELVMRLSKKNLGRNSDAVPCLTIDIELQVGSIAGALS